MEYKIITAGKDTLYVGNWVEKLEELVKPEVLNGWQPLGNPFLDPQGYLSQAMTRTLNNAQLPPHNQETPQIDD